MKALSILQPYAWLIVHGHKDIENRTWQTRERRQILVHAGKRYTLADHREYVIEISRGYGIQLPRYEEMPRGAIVGRANLIGCVNQSPSRWFFGPWGFELDEAEAFKTPIPYRGQLGFFEIPDEAWRPA